MSEIATNIIGTAITKTRQWLMLQRLILLAVSLLLVTLYGIHQGWFSGLAQNFNQHALVDANSAYLASLEARLLADYSALLGLSALVDVAASSQFGIDFIVDVNVQVGQLLNNLSQVLEQGKSYLLWAMAAIGALEIIAMLSEYIAPVLFQGLLWVVLVWFGVALFRRTVLHSLLVRQFVRTLLMLFLFAHIALPYSIHLSASATGVMDKMLGFQSNHQYFNQFAAELSGFQQQSAQSDLKQQGKSGVHFLHKAMANKLPHKVQTSSHTIMKSAAHLLLSLIVIPGLLLALNLFLISRLLDSLERQYHQVSGALKEATSEFKAHA